MRRALAVTVLGVLLLSGCRNPAETASGTPGNLTPATPAATAPASDAPTSGASTSPSPSATESPSPTPASTAGLDTELGSVDGLLSQLDDQSGKADEAPKDGDS